jgi:hypothetical protein
VTKEGDTVPDQPEEAYDLISRVPVIPVLTIESVDVGLPLARALVAGGLPLLEITLRTAAALEVIRAIAGEVEGAVVGAGTVLSPRRRSGPGPASSSAPAPPRACSTRPATGTCRSCPAPRLPARSWGCWSAVIAA